MDLIISSCHSQAHESYCLWTVCWNNEHVLMNKLGTFVGFWSPPSPFTCWQMCLTNKGGLPPNRNLFIFEKNSTLTLYCSFKMYNRMQLLSCFFHIIVGQYWGPIQVLKARLLELVPMLTTIACKMKELLVWITCLTSKKNRNIKRKLPSYRILDSTSDSCVYTKKKKQQQQKFT